VLRTPPSPRSISATRRSSPSIARDVTGSDFVLRDETLGLEYVRAGSSSCAALAADGDIVNDFLDKLQNAR